MARIRTIKPDFFRHEALYQAEVETGLPLRVAFAGLWTASDREGRFEWRPKQLKLDCLPYDEIDFSRVLDALTTRGFIVKYASDGEEYGYIPSWRRHQVVNHREAASKLPEPNKINEIPTREPRVNDASPTRHDNARGEVEGEGKGNGSTTPAISTRTTGPDQPAAGAVPADAGPATPTPPPDPAVHAAVEALRVGLAVGTEQHERAGELWAVMAANGVKGTASHPTVVEMARGGVTVAELRGAIAEARKSNAGSLNPAYLASIIDRMRSSPAKAGGKSAAWNTDDAALEAKAKELGMWPTKAASYHELRTLVRNRIAAAAEEGVR